MGLLKKLTMGAVLTFPLVGGYVGAKSFECLTEENRVTEIRKIENANYSREEERQSDLIWTKNKQSRDLTGLLTHGAILGALIGLVGGIGLFVYLDEKGYFPNKPLEKPIEPFDPNAALKGKTEEELNREYDYRELY